MTQITQEGSNYRVGSQLFSSQQAAQNAVARQTASQQAIAAGGAGGLQAYQQSYQQAGGTNLNTTPVVQNAAQKGLPAGYGGLTAQNTGVTQYGEQVTPQMIDAAQGLAAPTQQQIAAGGYSYDSGVGQRKPTEMVKPATATDIKGGRDYQSDDPKRMAEIQSNLKNIYQSNPELFKDRATYDKAFNYGERSDAQKALLDSYFNQLSQPQQQVIDMSYLSTYTLQDIKGKGLTEQEKQRLSQNNPGLLGQYQQYQQDQLNLSLINGELGEGGIMDMVQQMFGDPITVDLQAEQQRLMEQYQVEDKQTKYNEAKAKVIELQGLMNNKLNEIRKRYEGTGATEGFIRAMAAKENTYLQEELNNANTAYMLAGDNLQNAMTNVNASLEMANNQYQINRQGMLDRMQQAGFIMDLMSFETPAQRDERERNKRVKQQTRAEGDINSADPAIRKRAITNAVDGVLDEFKGITMVRSRDQMVDDITRLVNGGMSLGNAITQNIRNPIMQKDEYKLRAARNLGVGDSLSLGGYSVGFNNDGTMRLSSNTSSYIGTTQYNPADPNKLNVALQQVMWQGDGSNGGQCGSFVNDYLQSAGMARLFKDPIEQKKSLANSFTPKVGSIAIMDSPTKPEYGHVGIVTAINNDGTVTIKESNGRGDGKVGTRKVSMGNIHGYFDPTLGGTAVGNLDESYRQQRLSPMQMTSATAFITDRYGARFMNSKEPHAIQTRSSIYQMFAEGKNYDDIEDAVRYGSYGGEFTGNYRDAFDHIANIANMSEKTANQARNRLEDVIMRHGPDSIQAQEMLKAMAKGALAGESKSKLMDNEVLLTMINSIEGTMDAYEKSGGDTNIFKGSYEDVQEKILKRVADPKLREMAQEIMKAVQSYRHMVSGAAFTEAEAKEYRAMFPNTRSTKELNSAKLRGLKVSIGATIDGTYESIMGNRAYNQIYKKSDYSFNQQSIDGYSFNINGQNYNR